MKNNSCYYSINQEYDIDSMVDLFRESREILQYQNIENLVIIMGMTGAGKSTLLNYLFGSILLKKRDHVIVQDEKKEYFKIGNNDESQTLFPQIKKHELENINFCDSPGFFDSRSKEEQACASFNLINLIQKAQSIKGIIITIDYHSFGVQRGASFKTLIQVLSKIMISLEDIAESVIWAFTKTNCEDLGKEALIDKLERFLKIAITAMEKSRKQDEKDEKLREISIFKMILKYKSNIIIADVLDKGDSGVEIKKCIKSFKQIDKKDLKNTFDTSYQDFIKILENSANITYNLLKSEKNGKDNLEIKDREASYLEDSIKDYDKLINNFTLSGIYDPEQIKDIMEKNNTNLKKLKKKIIKKTKRANHALEMVDRYEKDQEYTLFKTHDGDTLDYDGPPVGYIEIYHKAKLIDQADWTNFFDIHKYELNKGRLLIHWKSGFIFNLSTLFMGSICFKIYICKNFRPDIIQIKEANLREYHSLFMEIDNLKKQSADLELFQNCLEENLNSHADRKEEKEKLIRNKEDMNVKIQKLKYEINAIKAEIISLESILNNNYTEISLVQSICEIINIDSEIIKGFLGQLEIRYNKPPLTNQDNDNSETLDPIYSILMKDPYILLCCKISLDFTTISKMNKCPYCKKDLSLNNCVQNITLKNLIISQKNMFPSILPLINILKKDKMNIGHLLQKMDETEIFKNHILKNELIEIEMLIEAKAEEFKILLLENNKLLQKYNDYVEEKETKYNINNYN